MKLPTLNFEHSRLTDHDLLMYEHKLEHELVAMQNAAKGLYDDERSSINLPLDKEHLRLCQKLAAKYKKVSLVVVVGIGGSDLGTMAVQEAILGRLYNLDPGRGPRILYADTVDPDNICHINNLMQQELKKGKNILLNVVSKSGGTTETIANFEVLLQTLARYRKSNSKKHVVVTTDEDSHLWHLAREEGFAILPIPKKVGGRYSVFSPVGLFPLAVLGINVKGLLDGAAQMRYQCLKTGHKQNPAVARAALLAHSWHHGRTIADNFYFRTDLESTGKWYRQLMGESIGKEWNKEHTRQLWRGMTPTVSIGSTDLHSMAQLYFGGPDDKLFTIITVDKWRRSMQVPSMQRYDQLVHNIQKKQLATIMQAITNGVRITLQRLEHPYCNIALSDTSEHSIGALLQLHMMEIMYLAALLDVNAFDQPNVEQYKIETKKILARK